MNEAIEFATAILDLERECPRGYNASAHITEYVHLCRSQQDAWFCCVHIPYSPLELREFFPITTGAQQRFWEKHHSYTRD